MRDWVRGYVLAGLAHGDGALVLDDTQAIKKGRMSVGVAPQHCGATGQTENCQCMVMLTYARTLGHAFIDRELYLPECWTTDRARCAAPGVPAARGLVTKPHLGIAMLTRALTDAALTFGWVVADSGYGRDPKLRACCHRKTLTYVFAVPVDLPLVDVRTTASRPDVVLAATRDADWERRSCGSGAKGQRYWDFAAHAVSVKGQRPAPGFAHTLLIRRALTPKVTKAHPEGILEVEYFLVHTRTGTPIPQMIAAAGLRWNIEDDNRVGKDLLGLDQYRSVGGPRGTGTSRRACWPTPSSRSLGPTWEKNRIPYRGRPATDPGAADRLLSGRHPRPARRHRAGPHQPRHCRRHRPRPVAPDPPDPRHDQPLPPPRRPTPTPPTRVDP